MKIALIGGNGDFNVENKGLGIQAYMYALSQGFKLSKINPTLVEANTLSILGNGLSYFISNSFRNFATYDIVHSLDVKPFIPFRKGKATWIATIHDFWPLLYPNAYVGEKTLRNQLYIFGLTRFGLLSSLKADFLIANSSLTKEIAIKKFGYRKDKIEVVNLGLAKKFTQAKILNKNKKDTFLLGYIGAFRPNKNIKFAIKAFEKIKDPNLSFELWGARNSEYTNLVNYSVIDKRITFKGFLNEEKKIDTLRNFDAFIFPSLYEGFGLPILEAQALGLPVITYKHAKIPDEVKKFCIEVEDVNHAAQVITHLKDNGFDSKKMENMIKYARSFTWEKTVKKTLEIYKRFY